MTPPVDRGLSLPRVAFGDRVENAWASPDNPTRVGYFVRSIRRGPKAVTWEITDRKGSFWRFNPRDIGERLTVTRAPTLEARPLPEGVGGAVARVSTWLEWGNPTGGMNLPGLDGTPSIRADLRTILAALEAPRPEDGGGEGSIASRDHARSSGAALEWTGVRLHTERAPLAGAFVIVTMERSDGTSQEVIRDYADITDSIISHWARLPACPSSAVVVEGDKSRDELSPGRKTAPVEGGIKDQGSARRSDERGCADAGPYPRSGLVERSEALALLDRLAAQHAEMALNGEPDSARNREAMEAAFTHAKYAVAFLPIAVPPPSYTLSEPHLSGWRVVLGYETLHDAQAAQENLAAATPLPAAPEAGQ